MVCRASLLPISRMPRLLVFVAVFAPVEQEVSGRYCLEIRERNGPLCAVAVVARSYSRGEQSQPSLNTGLVGWDVKVRCGVRYASSGMENTCCDVLYSRCPLVELKRPWSAARRPQVQPHFPEDATHCQPALNSPITLSHVICSTLCILLYDPKEAMYH